MTNLKFAVAIPFRTSVWALLFGMLLSASVSAQTNGTWSLSGGGNWSVPGNWQGGTIPDAGGTATFNNALGQLSNIGVTIDTTSRTLSQINFDQGFSVSISGSGGGGIIMSGSGLTLNGINSTISSAVSFYNTVNGISAVISGTGNLVKTGTGNVNLSGANTFTGTVQLNQGALWITGGNGSLGNTANAIEFNGGILGISTNALTTSRNVVVNAGGGTIRNFSAATISGALSGSGTLATQNAFGTTFSGNVSAFTGGLRADGGSTMTFNGATALGGSAAIEIGGQLTLSNLTNNVVNRLNGRSIVSLGGTLVYQGNAAGASSETAGSLTLRSGAMTITMSPNAAQQADLRFSSIVREDRATLFSRGISGAASGAGVANLYVTASPGTLIGGGGSATSTTASILPWMINNTVNTSTTGAGLSFVTWDAATQRIIPLDATTGYQTILGAAAANENVSLNTAGTVTVNAGGQTVNALRFGIGGVTLAGGAGDTLTVTSGAVLSTASTSTINAPLNFGSAEGVLFASGALTINGPISGTNGLTKAGVGVLTLTGANTYTGVTTLTLGNTTVSGGVVTADGSAPSVFGQDTSAINILSTNSTVTAPTRLWTNGNLVINRDINVKLGGGQTPGIGTAGASENESIVINGNVNLNAVTPDSPARFLSLEGDTTINNAVTINGNITGTGGLRANFASYNILSGNNSYSGTTLIGTSVLASGAGNALVLDTETWEARSSTAFGTGSVYFHSSTNTTQPVTGTGLLKSGGAGPITLANDIVLTNGFARFGGTQAITLNGNMFLNGAATNNSVVSVEGTAAPVTLNGVINGGGLIKYGAGTFTLAGSNTYSGQTIVREGTLSVSSIGNGGTVGNLGQAPSSATYLVLSGNAVGNTGSLKYTGGGETTDRLLTLQGSGGTIDASGTGALVFSNTGALAQGATSLNFASSAILVGSPGTATWLVANAGVINLTTSQAAQIVVGSSVSNATAGFPVGATVTEVGTNFVRLSATGTNAAVTASTSFTFATPSALTSRVLTLTGSNTGLNTFAPSIANATGLPVSLVKDGTGTWKLTGTNTYTGGTTVQGGKLIGNTTSLQGNITNNATLEFDQASNATFAGDINGNGTVIKSGSGKLNLNNAALNTGFTGNVNVTGGTLELDSVAAMSASLITVTSGATLDVDGSLLATVNIDSGSYLMGAGSVTGNVNMDGTFQPGNSPGTFSINGNLNLSASSVLNFELNETNQTPGGGINDLVAITGDLVLDGTLNVPDPTTTLTWTTSGTELAPITWTLFTYTGTLTNNGLNLGNLPTLLSGNSIPQLWRLNIVQNGGGGGSVNLQAVPEPSAALVLGGILAGAACLRRRRAA
jgi:fibronectin-binding autotransporter adhesin